MSFNRYREFHERAENAEKRGGLGDAVEAYLSAAEALLELAETKEGEERSELIDHAKEIIDYAKKLDARSATKPSPNAVKKEKDDQPKAKEESKESTDSEVANYSFEAVDISSTIGFDDVAGLEDVKTEIRERVIDPIVHPELYEKYGIAEGGGVLMYGPPGTGKTLIAKAMAREVANEIAKEVKDVDVKFFHVSCAELMRSHYGITEQLIKKLFVTARKERVSIIFLDEVDSLIPKSTHGSSVMPRVRSVFLEQFDGVVEGDNSLLIVGATNKPWNIEGALLRPGRFGEQIYVPLPDEKAIEYILKMEFNKAESHSVEEGIDFVDLAMQLKNRVVNGADVVEFARKAKLLPLNREKRAKVDKKDLTPDEKRVTKSDIEAVLSTFTSSVVKQDLKKLESYKKDKTSTA